MEYIFNELHASGIDVAQLAKTAAFFIGGALLISSLSRFIFGRQSAVSNAVSSSVGILFIYIATATVLAFGTELEQFRPFLAPLPFVQIEGSELMLFSFTGATEQEISAQLLNMVILAFLVNLMDSILPRGRNVFLWFCLRCVTVLASMLCHWALSGLLDATVPHVIAQNAPTILLGILILLIAVGALKLLVSLALMTVNPVIAALYNFFFANMIGLQLTKSLLTTTLLSALVWGLGQIGVTAIPVAAEALTAYAPFLGVLAALWYLINRIL